MVCQRDYGADFIHLQPSASDVTYIFALRNASRYASDCPFHRQHKDFSYLYFPVGEHVHSEGRFEDAARTDAAKAAFAFSCIFLTTSLTVSFFASTKLALFMKLGAV
jgi:elongation factor P hydroxylase